MATKKGDDVDVEGHGMGGHKRSGPEGIAGGHKRSGPDELGGGHKRSAVDDADVEGHSIGMLNPLEAREMARAREGDIQRSVTRNNLVSEAKKALRRKS